MWLFLSVALLLSGVLDFTSGSAPEPFRRMTVEESLQYLHDALVKVERRDLSDLMGKVRIEIQHDLDYRAAKEREQILKTVAEMIAAIERSVDERLLKEKNERLSMENNFFNQLQKASLQTDENITEMKNEVKSVLEKGRIETDMLEVQVNKNRDLIRDAGDTIRKNASSLARRNERLTSRVDDIQTNLTTKIGNLENSFLAVRENATSLDKSLQNLRETTDFEMRSIRNELDPQIKELKDVLANHSSSMLSLNSRLTLIESNVGDNGSGIAGRNSTPAGLQLCTG